MKKSIILVILTFLIATLINCSKNETVTSPQQKSEDMQMRQKNENLQLDTTKKDEEAKCLPLSFCSNEPSGFRGIDWGTNISQLTDFSYLYDENDGRKIYHRNGDEMIIGGAKLSSIGYFFCDGKFHSVGVAVSGYNNWEALKDACFTRYGEGRRITDDSFKWIGTKSFINLRYDVGSEMGFLYITSVEIEKQKYNYEQQKAREGAQRGF